MTEQTRYRSELSDDQKQLFLNAILDTIYALTLITPEEILQPKRGTADVALARQLAMYMCSTSANMGLTEIGELFNRDRTTVGHALQIIEEMRDDDFWLGNAPFAKLKTRKV